MDAGLLALIGIATTRADDLLELATRRRVYETIREFPGLHANEIARQLGLDANLVAYHLRALERHQLVSVKREAGYARYFARQAGRLGMQESLTPEDKKRLALLRRPVPLHVALLLLNDAELSLSELSRRTGVGRATVAYHVEGLERAGLVQSQRDGRERRCRLTAPDETLRLLLQYRPPDALVEGFLETWQTLEEGLRPARARDRRGESIL